MLANIVVAYLTQGGPVMGPILACMVVAIAVVFERACWWWHQSRLRDHDKLMKILDTLHRGDFNGAALLSKGSRDPVIQKVAFSVKIAEPSRSGPR